MFFMGSRILTPSLSTPVARSCSDIKTILLPLSLQHENISTYTSPNNISSICIKKDHVFISKRQQQKLVKSLFASNIHSKLQCTLFCSHINKTIPTSITGVQMLPPQVHTLTKSWRATAKTFKRTRVKVAQNELMTAAKQQT